MGRLVKYFWKEAVGGVNEAELRVEKSINEDTAKEDALFFSGNYGNI